MIRAIGVVVPPYKDVVTITYTSSSGACALSEGTIDATLGQDQATTVTLVS